MDNSKTSWKFLLPLTLFLITVTTFAMKQGLTVTSTAFNNNGNIPAKYSCQGAEVNPPLKVTGIPAGAYTLAIIIHDPDAPEPGGVTHWVAWNIPANGTIPENYKGGRQGLNSSKKQGYKGMCPPSGTHHYNFMVYALDIQLQLDTTTTKEELEAAIQGHVLAQGELTGLFSKAGQ